MTLLDWIVFGIIKTHAQAEKAAHDVIDLWHDDRIEGDLEDILGSRTANIRPGRPVECHC
jgi:hypothetical protein